jgi:tetratricopeptide (TPR) repeat protein
MSSPVKIVLLTMVKNEEKNMRRLFTSVKTWIDGIVVCDTGSTDSTVELSKKLFEEMKIPGGTFQYPWENFGKCRTKSFKCFQEWVATSTQWDPETVFALALDADMILQEEGDLHKNLAALKKDIGGVSIQQENGTIVYYNTRLLRCSDTWKCTGPTHEYWECDGKNTVNFTTPVILDIGDGGCKADKFTRDAQMLEDDLKENPNSVRSLFYLGQTYMSLGENQKAIKCLDRRIELGGWEEEVFMALIYKGDCLRLLSRPNDAVQEWLKAWQLRKHRTEAAARLISYYRSLDKMAFISYMYIEKLIQIQLGETLEGFGLWKPAVNNDVLFVSTSDMKYTVWEELGITAFYVGKHDVGNIRMDRVSMYAALDFNQRNRILELYQWYRWELPLTQKVKLEIAQTDIEWLKEGYWRAFNPSIRKEDDRYVMNLRHANYETKDAAHYTYRGQDGLIITRNVIAEMNHEFKVLRDRQVPVEVVVPSEYIINRTTVIHGVEDCRWFGKNSLIATTREYSQTDMNRMVRLDLDPVSKKVVGLKSLVAPVAREDAECQKNWLPFVKDGVEMFVYRINPFMICKANNEKVVEWKPTGGFTFDGLRGSAAPVPWKSERMPKEAWLMVVHFSFYGNGRRYYHRFLTLNNDLIPTRISKIFVSGDEPVQYVAGLCESLIPGRYVLTMGVNDSQAWALETEASTIESSLVYMFT